jgi:inner membrane protein
MPTIVTHAVAAAAIAAVGYPGTKGQTTPSGRWTLGVGPVPPRFWLLTALCAVLPDADVITYDLGLPYGHVLGHRGLSHSLAVAAVIGACMAVLVGRGAWRTARGRLFILFTLAAASHGVLDALVDEGLGVAFLAPFSGERYFFPWRPLEVAPIGGHGFFTTAPMEGGLRWITVLASEMLWVWLPAGTAVVLTRLVGRR